MNESLIYIGDVVIFEQDLGNILSIDSLNRTIISSLEPGITGDTTLQNNRLSSRMRISFDESYYSEWYDIEEMESSEGISFSDIHINPKCKINAEIEFKMISVPDGWDYDTDSITISDVDLLSTPIETEVSVKSNPPAKISAVGNDHGTEYKKDFYYDPYDMGSLERLQEDLSFMTNEIYGHKVDYVKVTQKTDKGTDYILREWNLFNVESANIKCIKVIVPNNEFPDSKFDFNMFGLEYPDMFEIHIVDSYFKKEYGPTTTPEQFDFLYFPIINRMYEVASTYIHRDFNMNPLYWKLTLTKYEKKNNVIWEDESKKQILEDSLRGIDEAFGKHTEEESKDLINESQLNLKEESLDYIRSYINPNLRFKNKEINHYFTRISDTQYDLVSIYDVNSNNLAVLYNNKFSISDSSAVTYTAWFKSNKLINNIYGITTTEPTSGTYSMELNTGSYEPGYEIGSLVSIYERKSTGRELRAIFEITNINSERTLIECKLFDSDQDVDLSKCNLISKAIKYTFFETGTAQYDRTRRVREFTVDEYTKRSSLFMIDRKAICIDYFGESFMFMLDEEMDVDQHYAIILSYNLTHRTIGAYIYRSNGIDPDLQSVQYFIKTGIAQTGVESDGTLAIPASPLEITNIRLISENLEHDRHSSYLTRNIIDNDSKSIVIDNALENIDLTDVK